MRLIYAGIPIFKQSVNPYQWSATITLDVTEQDLGAGYALSRNSLEGRLRSRSN